MSRISFLLLPWHLAPVNFQEEKGTSKYIMVLRTSWYVVIPLPVFWLCPFFPNICLCNFCTVCSYPELQYSTSEL